MSQLDTFRDSLKPALDAFGETLRGQIKTFEPEISEVVADVLMHAGKHLRPNFLFAVAGAEIAKTERAQRLACVVELIHLATLVHDDILDGASVRHGAPSHHVVWDNQISVLTGDTLFLRANELAAMEDDLWVGRTVAAAAKATCTGEIAQGLSNRFRKGVAPTEGEYVRQLLLKTGKLFGLACVLGAYLKGVDEKSRENFASYGEAFGIAYQLYDDAVDIWGGEETFKKTLGTDQAQHKWTLPWIMLRRQVSQVELEKLWSDKQKALEAFASYDIFPMTQLVFESYLKQASTAVSGEIMQAPLDYLRGLWGKLNEAKVK